MRSFARGVGSFIAVSQIPMYLVADDNLSVLHRQMWSSEVEASAASVFEWSKRSARTEARPIKKDRRVRHDDDWVVPVSSGDFYYLNWIHLYTAKLLVESGTDLALIDRQFTSNSESEKNGEKNLALELHYHRSIPGDKIRANAEFEMQWVSQKQQFPVEWREELANLNIPARSSDGQNGASGRATRRRAASV